MARMSPERWRRVAALLDQALELSPAERGPFLERLCRDDAELGGEVAALLAADAAASPLLDRPLAAAALFHTRELMAASADDTLRDRRIGAYRIVRELGHGGMGAVYLAERADGQFEHQVALKIVRNGLESAELVRRFRHERQILARLEHPNIARLLDGGIADEGTPFFVMEHVEGEPVTTHCDRLHLPVSARLRLFSEICDAVAYAHRNLIVHRDLKPSNILVTADGRVKLLDFGIAKLLDASTPDSSDETRTGSYLLTPEYAAPEQVRGDSITTATDVYALGTILYELLSGRRAHQFAQRSPAELTRVVGEVVAIPPSEAVVSRVAAAEGDAVSGSGAAVSEADAVPVAEEAARKRSTDPARLQRLLRGDLDAIVMKALRKEPQHRYGSVDALQQDIARYRAGRPVAARRGTFAYLARKYVLRHRGALAAAAVVLLSLGAGLIATTRQARRAERESARARAVTEFLVDLFRASDPTESRGRSVTALQVLDSGVLRVDRELADQPELQAEMLTVLGSIYRELAALPRADTLLRRAVALRERLHGSASGSVAESLNQLGGLLLATGDYADADSVFRRALAIRERELGPRDTLVAVSLNNLAIARANLGDNDEAERLYRRALAIDRRTFGARHLQVATDLSNLGGVLRQKAEYDAADSALSAAVDLRRQLLPENDPRRADAISQLAALRNAQGRSPEAESLHREALAIRQIAYGESHPDVALSLGNLASTLGDLGRSDEALPLQEKALAIQERALGPDHNLTIATINNIAVLKYRRGDIDAAAAHMREALARWRGTLGEQHPRVLTGANNLGVVLTEQRAFREAEPLLRTALAGRRALHGDEHPEVAASLRNIGVLLHHTGRHDEAEQAFEQALATGRRVWPASHRGLAGVLLSYGDLLLDEGRAAAAEPLLREALAIRRQAFAAGTDEVAAAERAYARALLALGRKAEAAALRPGRSPD